MSLAGAYASIIRDVEKRSEGKGFTEKLLSLMRTRGHLSLLPSIVKILENEPIEATVTLTVAHEADLKNFASEIKQALTELHGEGESQKIIVDPRAVGGYAIRSGSKIIDNTYRTALVSLYQKTIQH